MSSPSVPSLPTIEKVDHGMNDLRLQDGDINMELSTPTLSDEDLIENSRNALKKFHEESKALRLRVLHIETKENATEEEISSISLSEERITTLNKKIQRLENHLQQLTESSISLNNKNLRVRA
ncbi:hypothetical protein BGZ46_006145 [Entomortierella lignicola]|nr:hypothetical protein BGZ46_006145 [Entomortierella lignicola]